MIMNVAQAPGRADSESSLVLQFNPVGLYALYKPAVSDATPRLK